VNPEQISCNLVASRRYQDDVEAYYADRVLGSAGACICTHLDDCTRSAVPNTFAAAQLSYVGGNYAMQRNGQPWRIVVVSMQTGVAESPITMARRREQFASRVAEQFSQRNAHIKGVTSALRVLWGRDAGLDHDGELLETPSGSVNLLNAHALVNSTLCSSIKVPKSREGQGSDQMHRNCATHLRAVLERLEPTIVHSQGRRADPKHATPHRSMLAALDSVEWIDDHVAIARLGEQRFVWVSLGHPSAKGKYAWQHPNSPHFVDVVGPALRRGHNLAAKLASDGRR
jgi:hypothetical protein